MNIFKKLFGRKKKATQLTYANHTARNQWAVYRAVVRLGRPVNGRFISRQMGWDSASVTPRLSELVKKGMLTVAYRKRSLDDGRMRKYYVPARPVVNEHPGEL